MGRMRTRKNGQRNGQRYGQRNKTQKGGWPWSKKPTELDTLNELKKQELALKLKKQQARQLQQSNPIFIIIKNKYDELSDEQKLVITQKLKEMLTKYLYDTGNLSPSRGNISFNIDENRTNERMQVKEYDFKNTVDTGVEQMNIDQLINKLLQTNQLNQVKRLMFPISSDVIKYVEPTTITVECITSIKENDYASNIKFAEYFNRLFNENCKQELISTANVSILPNDRYINDKSWDLQCKYDYTLNNYMISEMIISSDTADTELFLNPILVDRLTQIKVSQYIEFIDYIKSTDEKTKGLFIKIIDQYRQDNLRGFNPTWTDNIINGSDNSTNVLEQTFNLVKENNNDINKLTLEELINYIIRYTIHINDNNIYTILVIFRLISLKLSGLKIYNSIFCNIGMPDNVIIIDISSQLLFNNKELFYKKIRQIADDNKYFNFDKFITGKFINLTFTNDNIIIQKYSYKIIRTISDNPIGFIYNQFTLNLNTNEIQNIDKIHWINVSNDIDNIFENPNNFENLYKKIISSLKPEQSFMSRMTPSYFRSNKVAPSQTVVPTKPKQWHGLWGGKRSQKRRKPRKYKSKKKSQ